ncbi:general stress protein [Dongia rigui]|uniref:General stress protein n=1 Tax=Dongia rigui TaxID=940149 RepID=A0ABU5DW39_9PROT|nr:general stress protein [Dongia rigui]MDY0871521.1 general stress protein [Dongia rigui]
MSRTVSALYDKYDEAAAAVRELEDAGIPAADISLVSNNVDNHYRVEADKETAGDIAADGAGAGSLIGGGAGLLAGLGVIAIPGIGPVVAAGWLAATAVGAAAGAIAGAIGGGIVGSLTRSGVSEEDAHLYAEGVRRGGSLVSVRVEADREAAVEQILHAHDHVDLAARGGALRDNGWRQFDESGRAFSEEELARARQDPRQPLI